MASLGLVNASTGNINNTIATAYGYTNPTNLSDFSYTSNPVSTVNADGTWGINLYGNNPSAASTPPSGGFNWQQGLGYGLAGLQALSGLMNAYTGYKNYKLAKEQFGFEKAAMNRNIANQAKTINNAYDNAAQVAAGMALDSSYGLARENLAKEYAADAQKKHVDGSAVG